MATLRFPESSTTSTTRRMWASLLESTLESSGVDTSWSFAT